MEKMEESAVAERLDLLRAKADAFFDDVQRRRPAAITCSAGCADCCAVDLSVCALEAERVEAALRRLPVELLAAAAERVTGGQHCALLDPETRRCVIYEERPIICRTHGLAVREDGQVDHCPLNYTTEKPAPNDTLVLERLNVPLALMSHLAGRGDERRRLADAVEAALTPSGSLSSH